MGNVRMFIYSLVLAVLLYFQVDKHYLLDEGVNNEISNHWTSEIQTIEKTCGKKVILPRKVLVDFGDTEGAIGYCQRFINGFKIIIDRHYWNVILDEAGKKQLLLHEMMHCIYKIDHNKKDPGNFMYPEYTRISDPELMKQLHELLKETKNCD